MDKIITARTERCCAKRLSLTYGYSFLSFAALLGAAKSWRTYVVGTIVYLFVWLGNPLPSEWRSELAISAAACCYVVVSIGLNDWCGWLSLMLLVGLVVRGVWVLLRRSNRYREPILVAKREDCD